MGFFNRDKNSASSQQNTDSYRLAKAALEQNIAFLQAVIDHVDGSNFEERKMVAEAREQKVNMESLLSDLQSNPSDPEFYSIIVLASTFMLMLDIVNNLDASSDTERELVYLAKKQLRGALDAGYPVAVDLYNKGQLPIW